MIGLLTSILFLYHVHSSLFTSFIFHDSYSLIPKTCTTTREFDQALSKAFSNKDKERTKLIFEILNARSNNVGVARVNFPSGSKNVYRSAILMTSIPCLYDLIKKCGIKHIIDISSPLSYNTKPWIDKEKQYFYHLVTTPENSQYIQIDDLNYKYTNNIGKKSAFKKVAEIVRQIESLEGSVLIHCLGGEHKTGIVFGVMQKCFNNASLNKVVQEYKKHAAWMSKDVPGGFKQENIDFIKDYPCEMIFG